MRQGCAGVVVVCGAGPTPAGCERRTDGSRDREEALGSSALSVEDGGDVSRKVAPLSW